MSGETFVEYKDSFSYGSRPDLSFKFLKGLSEEEAAAFFQDLITKVGETIDDGDPSRIIEHVTQGQIDAYSAPTKWAYDDGPFATLSKPVSESRIGLLTSTGHFVEGEDPEPFGVKKMTQTEAIERIVEFVKSTPELSEIPADVPADKLRVRHGGYDIRGVQADRNVALPLDRMSELAAEGIIGEFASPAYTFVGAAAQTPIARKLAPKWAEMFKERQIEGAVLVPV